MLTVLVARGIGDPMHVGMLANVTTQLDPHKFRIVELPYPAEYGVASGLTGSSFDASLAELRRLTIDAIKRAPGRVVLLGYSGGAAGLGDIAAEITLGWLGDVFPISKVAAVGLLADPRMPLAAAPHGMPVWGIAGSRPIPTGAFPTWWISDPADPICCTPPNSPLRTLADQSAAMSFADPAAWGRDLIRRLRTKQWQAVAINWLDIPATIAQYAEAVRAVKRYLGPDHTSYWARIYPGTDRTYCGELAHRISSLADPA